MSGATVGRPAAAPGRRLVLGVAACVVYLVVGLAVLVEEPWSVPVGRFVYPSAGLAFGLLYVFGSRMWPFVAVAAGGVTWFTDGGLAFTLATAAGNAVEALVGVAIVRRGARVLADLRDVGVVVLAGLAGALASATLGTAGMAVSLDLSAPALVRVWWMWTLGHSLGMLLFGAPIAALSRSTRAGGVSPRDRQGEVALLLAGLTFVSLIVFGPLPSESGAYPLQFLGYPFLIWAALRLHLVWVCIANMVLSTSALAWTAYGTGPFYQGDVGGSLIYGYVFSLVSWITTVALSAVMSGRRDSDVAMASREAAYQAVVEQAAEGIFVLDEQGRVVEANASAEPLMGCDAEAVEGLLFTSLLESPDRKPFARLLHGLERGSTDLIDWERTGEGGTELSLQAAVKRLADGSVHVFIRDVTKPKQFQRQLDRSQRMEAVGILAGGVAHDFNNLLTVIMGHAGRGLESNPENPEVRRHLEGILRAAERSSDLTNQLLTFARRSPTRAVVVDVDGVLDESEDMMRRVLGEGIGYLRARDGSGDAAPLVLVDPVQLERVLLNLMLNARDALPRGGQVTVATRVSQQDGADQVVIEVKDSGQGIPEEVRPRVFEPFFSTKSEMSRTGLGLAVCSRIVEAAAGRIEFDSEIGNGTAFRVVFPLASGEPAAAEARAPEEDRVADGARVLLIEDQAVLRALVQEGLEGRGHTVTSVPDGEAAIRLVQSGEKRFDVVLTDVILPGKTGPEVAKKLKLRDPDLVVLFMSGYDLTDLGGRGVSSRDLGAVIRKPFTIPALAKAVAEALERGGSQGQGPTRSVQHL